MSHKTPIPPVPDSETLAPSFGSKPRANPKWSPEHTRWAMRFILAFALSIAGLVTTKHYGGLSRAVLVELDAEIASYRAAGKAMPQLEMAAYMNRSTSALAVGSATSSLCRVLAPLAMLWAFMAVVKGRVTMAIMACAFVSISASTALTGWRSWATTQESMRHSIVSARFQMGEVDQAALDASMAAWQGVSARIGEPPILMYLSWALIVVLAMIAIHRRMRGTLNPPVSPAG